MKLVADVSMPTNRELTRRGGLFKGKQPNHLRGCGLLGAAAEEREKEKTNKYQELEADLAIQHPGWKVDIS